MGHKEKIIALLESASEELDMREILFRAKRVDNGEWVEGYYMHIKASKHHYILTGKAEFMNLLENRDVLEHYEVDPSTVCQYTGLQDKNGKKIWESDICDRKEDYPEIVKYHEGQYVLDYSYVTGKEKCANYCSLGFYVCERNFVEVIGNIFDNQELLEVEYE